MTGPTNNAIDPLSLYGSPLRFRFSPVKKEEGDIMKTIHAYRRAKARSNRSLLMVGIALLDCAFLLLCILAFGLVVRLLFALV